ncbi:hypothetical protein AAFC00_005524 [Neodothiora populina]|uniref:Uncharacterized protein n=1 Tax=Neodothiora populina TaxID=2781224 RepID=A0ABR3PLJ5_9PEZI
MSASNQDVLRAAAFQRFEKRKDQILTDVLGHRIDLYERFGLTLARFPPVSKILRQIQNTRYMIYPPYSRDDLALVRMLPDGSPGLEQIDPFALVAPAYSDHSCAVDTFLWISQVCKIRRVRCDTIVDSTDLNKMDALSRTVIEYLRLPLFKLTQQQLDMLRDNVMELVKLDARMHYIPKQGMDIENLFAFAWSRDVTPLNQISFTRAVLQSCSTCPAYGTQRVVDTDGIFINDDNSRSLEAQLAHYFQSSAVADGVRCPYCNAPPKQQRVVLDRMPHLLLWGHGCTKPDNMMDQYFSPVTFDVEYANEQDGGGGVKTWQSRLVRLTYRPAVLVIRDDRRGANQAHWYAASCLPVKDGSGRWLLYDGLGVEDGVNKIVDQLQPVDIMQHMQSGKHRVHVMVLQKQHAVEIGRRWMR